MNEACPKCGGKHRIQMKAYWWMKIIPNSALYQCNDCLNSYMSVPVQLNMNNSKVSRA